MGYVNKLSTERRAQVVAALVEGNSIRATMRMTGVARNTVTKLLADLGTACAEYHDGLVTGLSTQRVQADEIWSFCHAKQKNVPVEHHGEYGYGDVYTWVAIDADSKLAISWLVGERTQEDADVFMADVASRLTRRIQLTTDALRMYPPAVWRAFGDDIDFAQQRSEVLPDLSERRYSPPRYRVIETIVRTGEPDPDHITTSYVERQNLTMRMGMRRYTRLTNAFSKKIENHAHAVALHFMHFNFCRVHQTLGTTPAVAAGVADHKWTITELCELLQAPDSN
jgi:IS1 family transposase